MVWQPLPNLAEASSAGMEIETLPSECSTRGFCTPLHAAFHASHPPQHLFTYHSHSGDVFSWEGIGGVADKETGFPHSSGREIKNSRKSW